MQSSDFETDVGIADDTAVEEQIIAMSVLNCERLPMLDVIFGRLALSISSALRAFTSAPMTVSVDRVAYSSYLKAVRLIPETGLIAIARADPWGGGLAVSLDNAFLFNALEVMLGGNGQSEARKSKITRTSYTPIEKNFGQQLCQVVLDELSRSFSQVGQVTFKVQRMEINSQLATIAQPVSPCVRARLKISFGDEDGFMSILIPHSTVEPVRHLLTQVFFGEKIGGDENWRTHMRNKVQSATVSLKAVFERTEVPVGDVLQWKVGSMFELIVGPDHEATISCDGTDIFTGKIGRRSDGRTAVQLTKDIKPLLEDAQRSSKKGSENGPAD